MGKVCSKCGIDKPLSEYWMKRPALGQFYARCKPCLKSQHSEWNKANPEKGRSYYASWRDRDPERTRAVFREMKRRKELDPAKRFLSRIRNSVYGSLSGKRKTGRTLDILGYSMSVLTSHLERQFLPDMSWDNYGRMARRPYHPIKQLQDRSK